ncbi:cell division protein DedD [Photobacterium iliopiscarium]|uniref:cell division protein DedD n=1 Tax=Photobacterium iliopiscarium TaxID=56192 RepID=UPI001E46A6B4|nr:cell division protein DedD [Photobacterium iliopiscarium]MCD9467675.1 cell division protein DedD [Photobacterium iliopiscarium]MCD9486648.1 cell division protein DedD [Photobacterium iliopiscarium]MCF2243189.1 cell division protein DedD [Photobacterium iliopiscarium]
MASQFQNRLIGTIILVAVGVIFLPDFFDGKKEHYKEEFASIPLQPKMGGESEAKTIPEPENADVVLPQEPVTATTDKPVSTDDETYTIEADNNVTAEPQIKPQHNIKHEVKPIVKPVVKPVEKSKPVIKTPVTTSSAWVIKMGTFGNFDNANALVAKLRLNGYQAQMIPRNAKPGQYVKVVVGPDVSKAKLTGQIAELKKITGLNGKLNRFDAINP